VEPESTEPKADPDSTSTDEPTRPAVATSPEESTEAESSSSVDEAPPEKNATGDEDAAAEAEGGQQSRRDLPPDSTLAFAGDLLIAQAEEDDSVAEDATGPVGSESGSTTANPEAPSPSPEQGQPLSPFGTPYSSDIDLSDTGQPDAGLLRSEALLVFDEKIKADTLEEYIKETASELGMGEPQIVLDNPDWNEGSVAGFPEWTVQLSSPLEEARQIYDSLEERLDSTPVWRSASEIGSSVAGDKTRLAIAAVMASLLGIIGYIWIRFQNVFYGLAAVVALVHDVTITLGAIAISYWLKDVFAFLMIDEFKISLPVVAAFLTIIGYSLNDTIVLFDRIREVKGKSPHLTAEIINTSINQTLSRTLLTSLTTLLAVVILYAIGGQGIHAFAFALIVGVLVGTYSSIFVAAPVLLWMSGTPATEPVRQKATA
jgi:SecD/SecF fusion protein